MRLLQTILFLSVLVNCSDTLGREPIRIQAGKSIGQQLSGAAPDKPIKHAKAGQWLSKVAPEAVASDREYNTKLQAARSVRLQADQPSNSGNTSKIRPHTHLKRSLKNEATDYFHRQ